MWATKNAAEPGQWKKERTMPLPVPKNCRPIEEPKGIAFTVEIDGAERKALITSEAIAALYPNQDSVQAIGYSSLITRKVAEHLGAGDDCEPVLLTSAMFRWKGGVEVDKRRQWQFVVTERRTWKWMVTSPDGTQSESAEEFATLAACTSNAAQHGYVAWKSEEERRRELQLGVTRALKRKQ
jgi:hypothetical protein